MDLSKKLSDYPVILNSVIVLFGKWKIRLLWFINEGYKRPSELQRKISDASRRVLNIQLKELEDHELVTRKVFAVVPPKVEFSLTEFGKTLIPVIAAMGQWGDENEAHLRDVILRRVNSDFALAAMNDHGLG